MAEEGVYQLNFKADPEGDEIKDDNADALNEDKKSYKYLTKDGEAKAVFANGDTFEGTYTDLKRNGKGRYVFKKQEGWAADASYEGDYKDDMKEGNGVFLYPDGSKYVGEWANDQRHGQGTYFYASGDVYKGEWKDGKRHGPGVYACKPTTPTPPIRLFLQGSPEVAEQISKTYGAKLITTEDLAQAEAKAGSKLGKEIRGYLQAKKPVPTAILVTLVKTATTKACESGWILPAFPASQGEAEQLTKAGVCGDAMLVVAADEKKSSGFDNVAASCSVQLYSAVDTKDVDWALTRARSSSCMAGVWEDGELKNVTWTSPDGGKYVGAFSGGAPNGNGVFTTATGTSLRGDLKQAMVADDEGNMVPSAEAAWVPSDLVKRQLPKIRERLERTIRRAYPRVDQQLSGEEAIPGVPGFTELEGAPPKVYGMGTPTFEAIPEVIKKAKSEETAKLFVIVTRADPVCYLKTEEGKSLSFSPAMRASPMAEINMTCAEPAAAEGEDEEKGSVFSQLSTSWVEKVASASSGAVVYVAANGEKKEMKLEGKDAGLMSLMTPRAAPEEGTPGPAEIKSALAQFAETEDEAMMPLEFAHLPLPHAAVFAPEHLDAIIKVLKARDFATEALAFLNRDGQGSVPLAMVMAGLFHLVKNPPAPAEGDEAAAEGGEEEKKEEEGDEEAKQKAEEEEKKKEEEEAKKPADITKGEFPAIVAIVEAIADKKGQAYKDDVDAMIKRSSQADIVNKTLEYKDHYLATKGASEQAAKGLTAARKSLKTYAGLILAFVYMKGEGNLDNEELSLKTWLEAPEQKTFKEAFDSIDEYTFE